MSDPIVPDNIVPSGIRDERHLAYTGALDAHLAQTGIQGFVTTDVTKINAELLPAIIVEKSVQKYLTPDMPESVVRSIAANSYELHAKEGYIEGTKLGLSMLGIEVEWTQWHQMQPKGAPNTHIIRIHSENLVFEDQTEMFDERLIRAAFQMIEATQRHSQEIAVQLAAKATGKTYMGVAPLVEMNITVHPLWLDPDPVYANPRAGVAPYTHLEVTVQPQAA